MFQWLSKRDRDAAAAGVDAAERLIAEGNRAEDAGDVARACHLYRQAVARAPQHAKAHLNLGVGLEAAGDDDGAKASFESALKLEPAHTAAAYNLGKLLYARSAYGEADELLKRALAARTDFPEAHIVRGHVLHALGRLREAALALRTGLAKRPDDVHARAKLFHILDAMGDAAGAARELEGLLKLRPDWTEALYNYACTLMALKRDDEAEAALRRVLEHDPSFIMAYRMFASLLHRQGRIEETLALCKAGRKALPENLDLESFELFALNFSDRVSDDVLFERHRAFGTRLESAYPPRFRFPPPSDKATLRIGYVSADLSYHPVGLFLLPLLEHHDRSRFQVHCYASSARSDDFTQRLRARADVWRDVHTLPDMDLANLIHADGIDILIDLAGHSGVSRLAVFAQKPSPVQAAWLGYLNTTGLTRIDYRITDTNCDPVGTTEARHTEALIRLPASQWCYRPFVDVPHANTAPIERNGFVTFGSFTQTAKLTPSTLRLWARILEAVPDARLLIAGVPEGRAAERLRAEFECCGIPASRVETAPFLPVADYLKLYDRVDVGLDPIPYSGGTSTCDAVWMGVPVITLPGGRSASRSAASILRSVGLEESIAEDADDYVRRALRLARQRDRLSSLRRTLRECMRASPLTDERAFTRALEHAYEGMWQAWCGRSV